MAQDPQRSGHRSATTRRAELAERVYQQLKRDIHLGFLAPGSRLVERVIAREKGVSRTPVREALRRLHDDGLVEYRPGRGMVVMALSTADLMEIYALREHLEGLAVREAARRVTPQDLETLEELLSRARQALAAGAGDEVRTFNGEFHRFLIRLSGMRHVERLVAQLRDRIEFYRRRSLELPGRPAQSLDEHQLLLQTLRYGDPDLAEAAMRLHLRRARDAAQRWTLSGQEVTNGGLTSFSGDSYGSPGGAP